MYFNLLKTILRRTLAAFFAMAWVMSYGFSILWLSFLPISHFWLMIWPVWPLWCVLVLSDILPSAFAIFLAWLLGIMLDSLSSNLLGLHAIALTLVSYLKYYLSFTPKIELTENFHEIVPVIGLCCLYQIVIGVLEWIAKIPTQMFISHLIGTTVMTTILWYYCSATIRKVHAFFALDGALLKAWLPE